MESQEESKEGTSAGGPMQSPHRGGILVTDEIIIPNAAMKRLAFDQIEESGADQREEINKKIEKMYGL